MALRDPAALRQQLHQSPAPTEVHPELVQQGPVTEVVLAGHWRGKGKMAERETKGRRKVRRLCGRQINDRRHGEDGVDTQKPIEADLRLNAGTLTIQAVG